LKAKFKKIHISHIKVAGEKNFHKLKELLNRIEYYTQQGLSITADKYPYTASMTQLSAYLDKPFSDLPDAEIQEILHDQSQAKELFDVLKEIPHQRLMNINLISTTSKLIPTNCWGESIYDIANKLKLSTAELLFKILKNDATGSFASAHSMSKDNMLQLFSKSYVYCATDETMRDIDYNFGKSHPRGFSSFPKYIKIMLELGKKLEDIIPQISSKPAKRFKLRNVGKIKEGYDADITLFNIDNVLTSEYDDFKNPHKINSAIKMVFVNGKLKYDNR
jgi:N-acyl-D-amino-acid deacylase